MAFERDLQKEKDKGAEFGFKISEVIGEATATELAMAIKFLGLNQRHSLITAVEILKKEGITAESTP